MKSLLFKLTIASLFLFAMFSLAGKQMNQVKAAETAAPATVAISGKISYASGLPATGVQIQIKNSSNVVVQTIYTTKNGTYKIVVPRGIYTVAPQTNSQIASFSPSYKTVDGRNVDSVTAYFRANPVNNAE